MDDNPSGPNKPPPSSEPPASGQQNDASDHAEKDNSDAVSMKSSENNSVSNQDKLEDQAVSTILPVLHASENPVRLSVSDNITDDNDNDCSTVAKCGKARCNNTMYIRKCSASKCKNLQCYHFIHLVYKKNALPSLLIKSNVDPTHAEEVPI